jgi:hypothetical protein
MTAVLDRRFGAIERTLVAAAEDAEGSRSVSGCGGSCSLRAASSDGSAGSTALLR